MYYLKVMFVAFSWVVMVISFLICVVFLTLWERKILSYIALRKGPKKVSIVGLFQPMADTIKLVFKELGKSWVSNMFLYWFVPMLAVMMLFMSMAFLHFNFGGVYSYGLLGFLCASSVNVYVILLSGWGSNSKYSLLGCIRGAAQTISYEVCLVFMLILPSCYILSYKLGSYSNSKLLYGFGFVLWSFCWLVVCLAETNRAPFDFAEGESELVSGFNVEYGALQFAFLYLAEYGSIVVLSYLTVLLFLGGGTLVLGVGGVGVIFFFLWVRGSLPRFRYDLLMEMVWMGLLPFVFLLLFIVFIC